MSISPSSDLVLDVVRAADPASVDAARARLEAGGPAKSAQAEAANETFQAEFNRAGHTMPETTTDGTSSKTPKAYRDFEAMVLQTFIKEMLPKDNADVYGKGMSGDIWKGMLAQQIATVISKRGGIGIADHMLDKRFSGLGLESGPQSRLSGDGLNFSHGLVHQLQMQTIDKLMPLDGTTNGDAKDMT